MFGHLNLGFERDKKLKIYMCSLCHALGKEYGIIARFFINYEMALCLLMSVNYKKDKVDIKKGFCPLFSIKRILQDDLLVLKYVAAMSVLLVSEKIKDDVYDERKRFPKKVLKWINNQREKAERVLKNLGFDPNIVENALETQRTLEKRNDIELLQLAEPTAIVMSEIFSHSAIVNNISEYKSAFKRIGYSIGQIIYLFDCIADYKYDLMIGNFNPLCRDFYAKRDNINFTSKDIKEKVFPLLKMLQIDIQRTLDELPENLFIKDIFVTRLSQRAEEIFKEIDLQVEYIFAKRTPWFFSLPGIASSYDGSRMANVCNENVLSLLFMLFIIYLAFSIMCRGCFKGCCVSYPDEITVDHGVCRGKRTYKKHPYKNEYIDEEGMCC